MIKATFVLFFVLLGSSLAQALPLPKSYCLDIPATLYDGSGVIYAELSSVPGTADLRLTFQEGLLKGTVMQGPYDSTALRATLGIASHPLLGTATFIVDMSAPGLSTITITGPTISFNGTEGRCTVDFAGNYCAQINNTHYDLAFGAETAGSVSGMIAPFPAGAATSFTATVSAGGLNLKWAGPGGDTFKLEFTVRGLAGYRFSASGTYPVRGMRDPVGSAGCANVRVNGSSPSFFYYGTPTIVGNYIYVGSSGGFKHEVTTTNYFAKIDANAMNTVWVYGLGSNEVHGGAVLDSLGNVYFVVHEGRRQDTSGPEPTGDNSHSQLYLYKISNPSGGTPVLQWKRPITALGVVQDVGTVTPAIGADGTIYAGGDALYAFRADGGNLFRFTSPACAGFNVYSAPVIYTHPVTSDRVIFHSKCGIHAVDASSALEVWNYIPSYPPSSAPQHLSSPQFGRYGGTIYGVYSALYQNLYCFNPDNGKACAAWPGGAAWPAGPGGFPAPCTVAGITTTAARYRASPIVDSSGNIYIGTKDDATSKIYRVGASCSLTTPHWTVSTGADVYPTGVLTSSGLYIVGNESFTASRGTINAYDALTGALVKDYYLHGESTWASHRIHTAPSGDNFLIGTLYDGTKFLSGLVYSIRLGAGYSSSALNKTFRGANENTGR